MRKKLIPFFFILSCMLFAKGNSEPPADIYVSIPPQQYILEKLVGPEIIVESLISEFNDPHSFQPSPLQIQRLSQAKLYVSVGIAMEDAFLPKIHQALPQLPIFNSSLYAELQPMTENHDHHQLKTDETTETLEEHSDHGEMAMDPHFWLSPAEITNTLPALKNQLIILFPEYSETIESNFQQLMQDLQQLDEDLTQQLSPIKGQTILVYHPTLGYFCSSYGLEQVALETQGKEPSPRQLEEFIYTAQQKKIELILVQPQYSGQSAEVIAQAIHGRVESFNQLAYNWEENLRALADMLTSP